MVLRTLKFLAEFALAGRSYEEFDARQRILAIRGDALKESKEFIEKYIEVFRILYGVSLKEKFSVYSISLNEYYHLDWVYAEELEVPFVSTSYRILKKIIAQDKESMQHLKENKNILKLHTFPHIKPLLPEFYKATEEKIKRNEERLKAIKKIDDEEL